MPCRNRDLFPEFAGRNRFCNAAVRAPDEIEVLAGVEFGEEVVGDANRIVGILTRDGSVGFPVPVHVVGLDLERRIALFREIERVLNAALRNSRLEGLAERRLERGVARGIEPRAFGRVRIVRGLHDRVEVFLRGERAGDEVGDFLLFVNFPRDELLDVRMVDVQHDHLCGAPRRAAGFDSAGRAIPDAQKRHETRRRSASGELFAGAAQFGKVGAGPAAILKDARFPHPQIHDAALVDEIVVYTLDEARMGSRMLVGTGRAGKLGGLSVDVPVTLRRARDSVRPVQARIEPLR